MKLIRCDSALASSAFTDYGTLVQQAREYKYFSSHVFWFLLATLFIFQSMFLRLVYDSSFCLG